MSSTFTDMTAAITESVRIIETACDGDFPRTAIVLGSGLGRFAQEIQLNQQIDYRDLPAFPKATVEGHSGQLLIGTVAGTPVVCMQGRLHLYEGYHPSQIAAPIRTLKRLGVEQILLTNAAGALREDFPPGTLMALSDHINFSGFNPLIGPNDESFGPRFVDMSNAWDKTLRDQLMAAASEVGVDLKSGVYLQCSGPNFETHAEIRMFQQFADAVGMSTVPECLVARHCGIQVAGISVITNLGAGLADETLSHDQTIRVANQAYEDLSAIVIKFLSALQR